MAVKVKINQGEHDYREDIKQLQTQIMEVKRKERLAEMKKTNDEMAEQVFSVYESFKDAGFTSAQSFALIKEMIRSQGMRR